jgi:cytohesin
MTALFRGDIVAIGNWLADPDVEVDERDQDGRTTLHVACETGLDIPETIHWLLNRGADVNAVDSMGYTPLHHSARRGRMSVLRVLVEAGAAIDSPTKSGHTPLHRAAGGGHGDAVRYLIEHGAQVDARSNEYGTTPLMSAALEGRVEAARALIDAGADVDARNNRGESVLEAASSSTWVDVNPVLCLLLDQGADTAFVDALDNRRKREFLVLLDRCRHTE